MGKEVIYRCDKAGCKLTRPAISETNHWFSVYHALEHIHITAFKAEDLIENEKIFCGETHALEYIGTELPKLFPRIERSEDRESDPYQETPPTECKCVCIADKVYDSSHCEVHG